MIIYHGLMIPIDLDIDMLRCFVEVTRTGSFTKAGSNIGLTQSGVSVKIRRLEELLDNKLFNRKGNGLSITLEGEILLDYAVRILSIHDETVSRLTRPEASGKLKIGLIDYFLPELLPSLLSKFSKQYPNIHLEVTTDVGINLIPLFQKGELDLVVAGEDSYNGKSQTLFQEPLIWVMGKTDELPNDEKIHLALLPAPCSFRKLALESLEQKGIPREIVFTGSSISSIQAAVRAGMGISILPKGAMVNGLKPVPSKLRLPKLPIYSLVTIINENEKNDARDVFIDYIEAELNRVG